LGTVIPGSDPDYIAARGSMAIPSGSLLNLDRTFGLHPSVAALLPLWTSGQLGIVHAVGATESSRSHFDAQEQVERSVASPGTHTGWLARVLAEMGPGTTFRAVSEGVTVARSLAGAPGAIAMSGIESLTLLDSQPAMLTALESLFTGLDDPAGAHGLNTLQAMADAIPIQAQFPTPAPGAVYPNDGVGDRMADIARLTRCRSTGGHARHRRLGHAHQRRRGDRRHGQQPRGPVPDSVGLRHRRRSPDLRCDRGDHV